MIRNTPFISMLMRYARPLGVAAPLPETSGEHMSALDEASIDNETAWPQALPADTFAPAVPAQSGDITILTFLVARPELKVGSRVAVLYDVNDGQARVDINPAAQVAVRSGVAASVSAVSRDAAGRAGIEGSLTALGVPALPLSVLPNSWWSDARPAGQLMQDIWSRLAPTPTEVSHDENSGFGLRAPSRLSITGITRAGYLDLGITGIWSRFAGGTAVLHQQLHLLPDGDTASGAGSLAFTGSLSALSHFVDTQLLPFKGLTASTSATPSAQTPDTVEAAATWRPAANDGSGLDLQARLTHANWQMQARFALTDETKHFAVNFSGHPDSLATALKDVQLPGFCGIDNLAAHIDSSRVLSRAWNGRRRNDADCQATLCLRGTHASAGLQGTVTVQISQAGQTDVFTGGIGPRRIFARRATPHMQDEAGPLELGELPELNAALCGLHNVGRLMAGQQATWNSETLRAWGAAPQGHDLWLAVRRYRDTARAWLPASVLQSLLAVGRTLANAGEVTLEQENPGYRYFSA